MTDGRKMKTTTYHSIQDMVTIEWVRGQKSFKLEARTVIRGVQSERNFVKDWRNDYPWVQKLFYFTNILFYFIAIQDNAIMPPSKII